MVDEVTGVDDATWDALLAHVAPLLRTYPSVTAWVPQCGVDAQGAWAAAALLDAAGMLPRARIYASDACDEVVEAAKAREPPAEAPPGAPERVVWCAHDVRTDASLNEFHLVVLGAPLEAALAGDADVAARAVELVRESLCLRGVVVAGPTLAARFERDGGYERLHETAAVFRKRA